MPCESKVQADNTRTAISDLANRDSSVTGLGLMLDPECLLTKMGGRVDVTKADAIKLVYLRYKPHVNCLAQYELRVQGQTIQVYAKSHGRDAVSKLGKAMERPVIDSVLGPGRVVLQDEGIVISIFPNDAKLPGLGCLGDSDFRQRVFSRIFGTDSKWQSSTFGQQLNYKPERRFVARLTCVDNEIALVKFYSRDDYGKARTISRKLGRNREGFYPETIGRSKKHGVIAYNWLPGTTLEQLNKEGRLLTSDLASAANSLAKFHTSKRTGLSALRPGEQFDRINSLAELAGFMLPHLQKRSMHIAQQLIEWLAEQDPVQQPVHADFYDKQVIVSEGSVKLIDLDAARLGNPLLDLGSYIAHLEKQVGGHDMTTSDAAMQKETLVSAYELSAGGICTEQLDKYTALGLFGLIHHPFKHWVDNWPVKTEQLLERVEGLLVS